MKNVRRPSPNVLLGEELVPGDKKAAERASGHTEFGRQDSSEAGALPQTLGGLSRLLPRASEAIRQPLGRSPLRAVRKANVARKKTCARMEIFLQTMCVHHHRAGYCGTVTTSPPFRVNSARNVWSSIVSGRN